MPLQELALGLQMCSWETWFPKLPAERVSGKNIQQNTTIKQKNLSFCRPLIKSLFFSYVLRMKEFERERRLRLRENRLAAAA